MRTVLFICCTLLLIIPCAQSQTASYPDFEIVESIPVGTTLANADIRKAHDVWLEMIKNAKHSIDLEEFYISTQKGEPLDDIIAAIVEAGKRGVTVRLIADSRMYKTYPETIDMLGKCQNISVRIINYGQLAGGVQHSKYFIVDGEQIFLGSQNFDWRSLKHIHELGIRIKHKDAVAIYQDVFNIDWQLAEKNDAAMIPAVVHQQQYKLPFHIVEEGNDTLTFFPTMSPKGLISDSLLWDERNIVALIDAAQHDVFCQFLTYSPIARGKSYYPVLNEALKRAAARGVHVHMIVADWSKYHPLIDSLVSLSETPNIQIKFSDIPDWSGGYVSFARVEHCKYLVVDSLSCWLGTANWEKGYFYDTRNVGVVVYNRKITSTLRSIFLKGWDGPYTELIKRGVDYPPRRHGEN